jgi:hypothetical protein
VYRCRHKTHLRDDANTFVTSYSGKIGLNAIHSLNLSNEVKHINSTITVPRFQDLQYHVNVRGIDGRRENLDRDLVGAR